MEKKLQKSTKHGWDSIGRDWGLHLKRTIQYPKASRYFQRALEVNPKNTRTLLESSRCKLDQCRTENALDDITKSMKIDPKNVKSKHQYAKCLYNLNETEDAFSVAHEISAERPTNMDVRHTKDAIEMSLRKAFCPSALPILLKYKMHLQQKSNKTNAEKTPPLPIVEARENAIELMKHKLYFDSTYAEQLDFWKRVQLDETLDEDIHQTIERIISNLNTHENMLYIREPFYARRDRFDLNSLSKSRKTAACLKRMDIHREALNQLEKIQELAKSDFFKSLALVERFLSDFYAITNRADFPAKFQFICKIVHFVGSEYLKTYRRFPCNFMNSNFNERLEILFDVWGEMLQNEDECDEQIKYFMKRFNNAEYAIEKFYILHRMSEISFQYGRPEESKRYAHDLATLADQCNSNIWKFLGLFNIIRVDTVKRSYHEMMNNLQKLQNVASNLDSFCQIFVSVAIRSFQDIQKIKS